MVPNVFRALDSSPRMLESNWGMFKSAVLEGNLPRTVKEMVGVVVSQVNGSEYARQVHLHSLGMQGVTEETLARLAAGNIRDSGLPASTIEVLEFAQSVARDPSGQGPSARVRLRESGLSDSDVLEVVGAVQLFSAVNIFTDIMGVPVDGA